MSCPTCSHAMHHLGTIEGRAHYHCPRCGTHRIVCGWHDKDTPINHDTVPSLVTRCHNFAVALANPATGAVGANLRILWHSEGIAESINTPENRP